MVKSSIKESVTIAALTKRLNYTAFIIAIKQFLLERGFNVKFMLNTDIYPTNKYESTSFFKNEHLFIIFPFKKMLLFVISRKFIRKKSYYWFHEPFTSFSAYRKSGNSFLWITQFYLKSVYSYFTCFFCDTVFIPSDLAVENYKNSIFFCEKIKFIKFPLVFPDRTDFTKKEKLISYLGTISKDHAFDSFIEMIINNASFLIKNNFKVLIATSNNVDKLYLDKLNSLNLNIEIIHSNLISDRDMNSYYSRTFLLWNAYHRSTQSAVLVNAFRHNCIPIFHRDNIKYEYENISLIMNSKKYLIDEDNFKYILNNSEKIHKVINKIFLDNYSYKSLLKSEIFLNEV